MDRTLISVNWINFGTVVLMAAVGWAMLMIGGQVMQRLRPGGG